jgi:O-antigen/teichoic acid export membrane protein
VLGRPARAAGWVIGDQALISLSNFIGMVVIARGLPPAAFGVYVLAYTALTVVNNVQSALITQPHSVIAADKGDDYRRYTTSTLVSQLALAGAVAGPLLIAGAVGVGPGGDGSLLIGLGAAVATWQSQEFVRRVLYFEGRLMAVFANDAISYGGQLILFGVLAATSALTSTSALLALALTSAAGALVGTHQLRRTFVGRPTVADVRENLGYGKWLLGGEMGAVIGMVMYPYLLAITKGPESAAALAACMLILNPLNVLWFAVGTAFPIRLARTRVARGEMAAERELWRLYRFTIPVVAGYCLAASVVAELLLGLLYGGRYAGFGWVVAVGAIFRVIAYHAHLLSVGLRARRLTRPIFEGYAIGAPFSLLAGPILTAAFGIIGALGAMIGAALIWTAVWWRAYRAGAGGSGPDVPAATPQATS